MLRYLFKRNFTSFVKNEVKNDVSQNEIVKKNKDKLFKYYITGSVLCYPIFLAHNYNEMYNKNDKKSINFDDSAAMLMKSSLLSASWPLFAVIIPNKYLYEYVYKINTNTVV